MDIQVATTENIMLAKSQDNILLIESMLKSFLK